MRRLNLLTVLAAAVFLMGTLAIKTDVAMSAEDEIAKCKKELARAQRESDSYKKRLLESGSVAKLKSEGADLNDQLKSNDRELTELLNAKLHKNSTYLSLVEKSGELDKANAELKKRRAAADSDPEVKKLQQEAADLKAKAEAASQGAKKLADSKYNSDPMVRELAAKKAGLESAPKEVADFKKKVMGDPQVKTSEASIADVKKKISAKNVEIKNASDALLKSDERCKTLAAKVNELTKKLQDLTQAKGAGVKAKTTEKKRRIGQGKCRA